MAPRAISPLLLPNFGPITLIFMVPSSFFTDDSPIHVYLKSDSLFFSSLLGVFLGFICLKSSLSLP